MNAIEPESPRSFSSLLSDEALKLVAGSDQALIEELGSDVVRDAVFNVFIGRNLRDSTEVLTRRRIAALNLALSDLFLQGATTSANFVEVLPSLAADILGRTHISKSERWIAQWMLGLTGKAVQNVLRDDPTLIAQYRDSYIETCRAVIARHSAEYGELNGHLKTSKGYSAEIDWLFMAYLLNTIGAQTLTILGSEKSAYGKLFEKLTLGALLHILDFRYKPFEERLETEQIFWLSQRNKRESDATLLYGIGKGVRFDIGFIGRGNSEISLDQVTRFEREIQLGTSQHYMATIIIVDRLGAKSKVAKIAQDIGGTVIQMSAGYWPQKVAQTLHRVLGYDHELVQVTTPPPKGGGFSGSA